MKRIGIHIRLTDLSLATAAQKALRLGLSRFQCFFVHPNNSHIISFSQHELLAFKETYAHQFDALYAHASYWVNLAGLQNNGFAVFQKELSLAEQSGFTHLILHPGSAKGAKNKTEGIDALARALNTAHQHESSVKVVLENTAHANFSVGSDLRDFGALLEKLDKPERVSFAIDTAHAYVYGHDIATAQGQEQFFALIKDTIGFDTVAVLHLNDSVRQCGSYEDKHAAPGQGHIGWSMLHRFAIDERIAHVPIILELPTLEEQEERAMVDMVGVVDTAYAQRQL